MFVVGDLFITEMFMEPLPRARHHAGLWLGWGWGLEVLGPVIAQYRYRQRPAICVVHMLLCGHFLKKKDRITALKYR